MSTDDPLAIAPPPTDPLAYETWLDGIVRLEEGGKLRGVHPVTLKKDAVKKGELLKLGERAVGVRRRFALMLPPREGRGVGVGPRRRRAASPR